MVPLSLLPLLVVPALAINIPVNEVDVEASEAPAVIRSFILSSTPYNSTEPLLAGSDCSVTGYYGAYGRPLQHIYSVTEACMETDYVWPGEKVCQRSAQRHDCVCDEDLVSRLEECIPDEYFEVNKHEAYDFPMRFNLDVHKLALFWEFDPLPDTPIRFVWLQDSGVDASLRKTRFADSTFEMEVAAASAWNFAEATGYWEDQKLFGDRQEVPNLGRVDVIYRDETGALMAMEESRLAHLDLFLPPYASAIALPSEPYALTEVPSEAVARVKGLIKKLRFNPDVASIISTLSIDSMRQNIRHLTGEDGKGILSRHSFSQGARVAANWIQQELESTGAKCYQKEFIPGYSPNVICRYEGTSDPDSLVLLSAHYDSRGTFGSTRAPGGNDDGSGTTHLLAVARAIKENEITFKSSVELCAFAGEEQGLRGSNAYARELHEKGTNITLMIQADMLAYHSPLEPPQLGLPDLIGLPEAAWLVANVSRIYSPELTVGVTPACCSDHQSFHQQGFPSTQVYERAGPIIDPMYHNSGDLSDRVGYDLQQVRSIAKVTFATVLEAAGFEWNSEVRD